MAWPNAFLQPSTHPENCAKVPCFLGVFRPLGILIALGITQSMALVSLANPGVAAEKVVIHYGSFQGEIRLDELESSLGRSPSKTTFSLAALNAETTSRFQRLLTKSWPSLSPEQLDNLFRSPSGETFLRAVAEVALVSDSPAEGAANLRTALVSAAASNGGLTGLNVLRHFPGDIHWNAHGTLALWQRQQQLQQETDDFLEMLDLRMESGRSQPKDFKLAQAGGSMEDLRLAGDRNYHEGELQLWDAKRDRHFQVQLYLPERSGIPESGVSKKIPGLRSTVLPLQKSFNAETFDAEKTLPVLESDEASVPLMVMSHGLAANRHSRSFLAKHLASHGIAVAMVQHPGSDTVQFKGLLQGKREDLASAQSFIDRPQDISFLLDELGRLGQENWDGPSPRASQDVVGQFLGQARPGVVRDSRAMLLNYPLQLDQVAVFGHSFGAYTALALAGAEINFSRLRRDCQADAMLLDLSLVLQCQALELEGLERLELKDQRVAALMLADPVSRSIFGPEGLNKVDLPVVWSGGERDRFTPFGFSQLPSFQWLGSEHKYLAVAEATSHIYLQTLDDMDSSPATIGYGEAVYQATAHKATVHQATDQTHLTEQVVAQPQAVQDYTKALSLALIKAHLHQEHHYQAYLAPPHCRFLSQAPYHLRLWSPNAAVAETATSLTSTVPTAQ